MHAMMCRRSVVAPLSVLQWGIPPGGRPRPAAGALAQSEIIVGQSRRRRRDSPDVLSAAEQPICCRAQHQRRSGNAVAAVDGPAGSLNPVMPADANAGAGDPGPTVCNTGVAQISHHGAGDH